MKSTKIFAVLLALVMVVMLASTGTLPVRSQSGTPDATAAATVAANAPYCTPDIANANQTKGYTVAMISKGFQHQFWQAVKKGSYQAGIDCGVGVTFVGPATESQIDVQINMLTTALAKNPSALGFAALDTKAALPLLQKAKDNNIPVIAFDSGVDSDIPITTAATDNVAAAALIADKMAALIGDSGEVAAVIHDQTSRTGKDRTTGFVEQMKKAHPNITIVSVQYGAGDILKSTDITKSIIQAHPNIKGIFGGNEGSIQGVLKGVQESGMTGKIVVIGYDSGQAQMDAIRSGAEAGAVTQDPIGIGYKSVEAAVKALNGVSVPKNIDTGFHWYDKTNIDDPAIAALLYK
jgi:ribose transport system substrate-binding protein